MDAKSAPMPEDLAAERLVAAVESAIGGIQERLANLASNGQDTKWSVSDLVRLLQLRDQPQGERPRNICVQWVDDPDDIPNNNNDDDNNQPETDTRLETYIDAPNLSRNHINKETRK
jgi:hypothetical protein